ncbi:MAG: hypothetical protein JXA71_02090 [Chitinispirillaceae bacterium]|nr:hypothetical protein [Chitinispirillaceae bacterium]
MKNTGKYRVLSAISAFFFFKAPFYLLYALTVCFVLCVFILPDEQAINLLNISFPVVGAHIAEKSNDTLARRNYRLIARGSGIVDTLTDNLGLVALLKKYPKWVADIKPGGMELSDAYLDEVVTRAVYLLQMRGIVVEKGIPQNGAVDRQNRLLTLCLDAQSHIKKYAYAAFFDSIEYYESNYASARSKPAEVEETATDAPTAA